MAIRPFTTRKLPFAGRLSLTLVLAILGGGYISSFLFMVDHHQNRDGREGLSKVDIEGIYSGTVRPPIFADLLRDGHPTEHDSEAALDETDREVLLEWLTGENIAANWSNIDFGDGYGSPQEIVGMACASCHGAAAPAERRAEPELDDWSDYQEIALEKDRHFFAGQTGPFWVGDTIWTTKKGLERRSLELKELREVKIPANEEAIGRAASYGDLSENAEWEAAMEEQRNLTSRAMAIEEELRLADLIEEAAIPEDTVAPGTIVNYREVESGSERRVILLGPWDDEVWNEVQVVSYRAPLAKGLLGLKPGEQSTLELPSGSLDIQVLGIETPEMA